MDLAQLNNLDLKDIAKAPMTVKAGILAFLLVAIVGGGYYLDWSSGLEQLNAAREEEKTLRDTYAMKKRQAINLQAYKQRLADTEKSLAAMLRQLPNKSEMDALLSDINQAGIGRGLEFELFRPGSEQPSDFYATLPVAIRVMGDYHQLGSFISDAAKLPRIVTMHDLAIGATPPPSDKLVMDATIRTYRYLDENEAAAVQSSKDKKQ